jgi:hypothetical protein
VWPAGLGLSTEDSASATRFIALGTWLAVLAFCVQSVAHLVVYRTTISVLNADSEAGLWAWTGSSATFAVAVGVLLLIVLRPVATKPLAVLAVVLAYFSLDDAIALHERFVHRHVHSLGPIDDAAGIVWPVVYLPMLVVAFGLLWTLASFFTERSGRLVRVGLLMLVAAVLAEFVAVAFKQGSGHDTLRYHLEVVVEEGLELAGWVVVATGVIATALTWASERPGPEAAD